MLLWQLSQLWNPKKQSRRTMPWWLWNLHGTPLIWHLCFGAWNWDFSWCRVLQPGQGCLALGTPLWPHPQSMLGMQECTHVVPHYGWSMESLRLPGFCGTAWSSELWGDPSPCRNATPLPQHSHASGRKGLDVALPTLLVEAGSGGSCGHRWPSSWPRLDRGWRGQRNVRLWQNSLYEAQACSQSTLFVRFPIRKAPAMQRGGSVRIRFRSHLSSPLVVGSELIQKQVVSPVSERNSVV